MTYETIILEKKENIATITLNRPEKLNALTPLFARLFFTFSAENRSSGFRPVIFCGSVRKTMSAPASASAYCFSKMRRLLVFERGSKAASMRFFVNLCLIAVMVSETSVGWCAKSSITVTLPKKAVSCLRLTPAKFLRARLRISKSSPSR